MPVTQSLPLPPVRWSQRLERQALVWRAKALLFVGRKAAAKAVFERILERWPQDVLAINSLAYDALLSDHKTQALQYYAQALALQPQVCNAHFNHAYVAEQLDQLALAEEGFRAALQIDEKMDRAWYGLGLVLVRQGRLQEALQALDRNPGSQPPPAAHEPLWLVPDGACARRSAPARGGTRRNTAFERIRAQGGRATGAGDRFACRFLALKSE